ncbi:YolD-like family protein [Paenibacillus donghaensis]|nr:YolD-like family protein [Paenibacillus donghaensis]
MRKKLEGNGLWESSRMMLIEHKDRILDDAQRQELRRRPELDPQALDELQHIFAQSMEEHSAITLTLFDPEGDRTARGIVMMVNVQHRQLKFRWSEDDWDWISIKDVMDAAP